MMSIAVIARIEITDFEKLNSFLASEANIQSDGTPRFSECQIRHIIGKKDTNGFAEALSKVGHSWYMNVPVFGAAVAPRVSNGNGK